MVEILATPEDHRHFVIRRWNDIAGLAWQQYTNQGPGAVIINQAEVSSLLEKNKNHDLVPVPMYFFNRDTVLEVFRQTGYRQEIVNDALKAIDIYKPTEQVVVIFLYGEESVSIYRLRRKYKYLPSKGATLPPVAAQGQKTKLN